jgi:hypothetical protein
MACTYSRHHYLDFCSWGQLEQLIYATCLHQECLLHKQIVSGDPTDNNPKDCDRAKLQAMELVSISEHVCMDSSPDSPVVK